MSLLFLEGTVSFLTIATQCVKNDNKVDFDFEIDTL